MAAETNSKRSAIVEHALVFAGDLLPYGVMFLLTLSVGYSRGLQEAGFFSLSYAYVAIVTALVCGPNLLSVRRRMPSSGSPGAVVAGAMMLRAAMILAGGLLLLVIFGAVASPPGMLPLLALLIVGRLLETSVDAPATGVQYLCSAAQYFGLRLVIFVVVSGITLTGVLSAGEAGLLWIASAYVLGSAVGLFVALWWSHAKLTPLQALGDEVRAQIREFGRFFLATLLFLAASRLHPIFITYFSGPDAAGQFALVQNLFSALALAASAIAGVYFWSSNRRGSQAARAGVPWRWGLRAIPGGLLLGLIGGALIDWMFLRPLDSPTTLRLAAWMLCAATPLLLIQSIFSNQLVLMQRDGDMLRLSAINAVLGLLIVIGLVDSFGIVGAAASVGTSALLSSIIGFFWVRRRHE